MSLEQECCISALSHSRLHQACSDSALLGQLVMHTEYTGARVVGVIVLAHSAVLCLS